MPKITDPEFVDFDEADEESEAQPIKVRIQGKEYEFPASPDARAILKVRRLYARFTSLNVKQATGQLGIDDADTIVELAEGIRIDELLAELVGQEYVDEWLDNKISDAKLKKVFQYLWRRYNGKRADEPDSAPKANRATRRATAKPVKKTTSPRKASSKTGRTSKVTSKGSTKSTSRKS